MANWLCIQGCGACCHLEPRDRPDLDQYLTPSELAHYLSLVGDDGWCLNYDAQTRRCTIYDTRPSFCRVNAGAFEKMYGIAPDELDEFAIDCCEQQIEGVYGNQSEELDRFTTAVSKPVDPDA